MSSPLDFLKEFFEGNIDFVGQHYAEEAARSILIAGTVLSFFAGYFSQSMKVTFSALGSFVVLAAVLVIPPWPMYRSNPVSWLPPVDTSASTKKKA
ncbi:microsomal signal peptidase subunit [Schizophyllum commune Tattone D]|nr:microsomal signal peptidase subunit [Schizophyllum commune Tattone D]